MIQPEASRKDELLEWSTDRGTEVWARFGACIAGDLETVKHLLAKDPALVRCQHAYRKALYSVARETRLEVAGWSKVYNAN